MWTTRETSPRVKAFAPLAGSVSLEGSEIVYDDDPSGAVDLDAFLGKGTVTRRDIGQRGNRTTAESHIDDDGIVP